MDIFTRLITDYGTVYDRVPSGYKGKLYAEIASRTCTVGIRAGMRLSQLRFVRGNPDSRDMSRIKKLDQEEPLVYMDDDTPVKAQIDRGLRITINLEAAEKGEVIAYKAKRNAPVIELDKINHYPSGDFWEMQYQTAGKSLILDPGDFYILASRERVRVPPDFAAEIVPFDPSDGEFRIHYAGFFDPGFGYGSSEIKGTRAVLEVRAHEVPFLMEHGGSKHVGRQPVAGRRPTREAGRNEQGRRQKKVPRRELVRPGPPFSVMTLPSFSTAFSHSGSFPLPVPVPSSKVMEEEPPLGTRIITSASLPIHRKTCSGEYRSTPCQPAPKLIPESGPAMSSALARRTRVSFAGAGDGGSVTRCRQAADVSRG